MKQNEASQIFNSSKKSLCDECTRLPNVLHMWVSKVMQNTTDTPDESVDFNSHVRHINQ